MVGIDADFSDVDQFFEDGTSEVVAGMKEEERHLLKMQKLPETIKTTQNI